MGRVIVVSNRLPVTVAWRDGQPVLTRSNGGLVSGLTPLQEVSSAEVVWVGWPGVVPDDDAARSAVRRELAVMGFRPVFLGEDLSELFYEGYSNSTLWPLLHSLSLGGGRPMIAPGEWDAYRTASVLFADEVVDAYTGLDDIIWVHDYHMFLVPGILRERLSPSAAIAFFLHVPFPPVEVFRSLPHHREIVASILEADLIGFHTDEFANAFTATSQRICGHCSSLGDIVVASPPKDAICPAGRIVRVGAFPMGIDVAKFRNTAAAPRSAEVDRVVASIRSRVPEGSGRIVYSLSRLDITKGIANGLRAFRQLLVANPELLGSIIYVLVVVPSREKVEQFAALRGEIEGLVGQINGAFSTMSWTPVVYMYRSLSWAETIALYAAADVGVVIPIRDGLNLVAKEFAAVHSCGSGALVLSNMAGCAKELCEAVIVNPNDIDGVAAGMAKGLRMPVDEQRRRNAAMGKRLVANDVCHWLKRFLHKLAHVKERQCVVGVHLLDDAAYASIAAAFSSATSRVLFLDYDGTIVGLCDNPSDSSPPPLVADLLNGLGSSKATRVVVVSGRDRHSLGSWLGGLPVDVAAEHGAWRMTSGAGGQRAWKRTSLLVNGTLEQAWKPAVKGVLQEAARILPGSAVEEKTTSVVFHYRRSRSLVPDQTEVDDCVRGLSATLSMMTAGQPVRVVRAKEAIEVRDAAVNKGAFVRGVLKETSASFIMAVGDDETDEDMFEALSGAAATNNAMQSLYTVRVGNCPSKAMFNVESVGDVIKLLSSFAGTVKRHP